MANIFDGIGPTTTSNQAIPTNNLFDNIDKPIKKKKNLFDDIGPENNFSISTEGNLGNTSINAINSIGPGTIADNTSAWDAFTYGAKLGFTDTVRGVTQIVGGEKVWGADQSLKDQQKELYERFQDEDFGVWTKIGYFGGAILDPITWLIPVAKANTVYKMAKYGAMSGGLFGALGYVDEENPLIDTRTKQAAFGALAGGIVSPIIGTAVGQTGKLFGKKPKPIGIKPESEIKVKGLNDSAFSKIKAEGGFGEASRTLKMRKESLIEKDVKPPEIIADNPLLKSKEKAKILNPIRLFFKDYLADPVRKPFTKAKEWYRPKGERAYEYLTTGKYGTEIAGGTAGAIVTPQYLEDDASMTQKFSAVAGGFIAGALGIKGIKMIPIKRKLYEGTKAEKEVQSTLGELLAVGIRDDYGLPVQIKNWKLDSRGTENMLASKFVKLAAKVQRLPQDERAILLNMIEGNLIYKQVPSKTLKNISEEFRQITKELGQKYVDYGFMSAKSFQRNLDTYMRRTYTKDAALSKIGDELKPRGVHVNVRKEDYEKIFKKDFAFRVDKGSDPDAVKEFAKFRLQEPGKIGTKDYKAAVKKLVKGSKVKGHRGWEIFDVNDDINKLFSVKEKATLTSGNTNSVAFKKIFKKIKNKDEITIRWELTKQERMAIGQIEDAALAIAETGRILSGQLARTNYYNKIAKSGHVYANATPAQVKELGLVKVPNTELDKTLGKKTYGNLANKYLPKEIADNIFRTHRYATTKPSEFYKKYRILNQTWKISKTAFNPTVHVNNTLSNVILYDLVDGANRGRNLMAAHKAITASSKGKESQLYTLAKNHSVLDSDLITNELKDVTKYLKTNPYSAFKGADDPAVQSINATSIIWNDIKRTWFGTKTAANALTKLYRYEDQVFRIALFKDRLDKGWAVGDAARDARRSFIDYDINAPLINWMRNAPTPFLAYTYRVAPLLAETAVVRPWKFAKWAAIGYALNGIGQYVAGGDEEAERAVMSKQKQGRVFGLAFMPQRNLKVPATDANGNSVYIDITRFVPGGDVLDLGSAFGAKFPGIPAPVQPTFGLAGDVIPAIFGYDLFKGERLKGLDGSVRTDWGIRLGKAFANITPNFPFFPGSYTTQRMERAQRGVESPFRVPETEFMALVRGLGFKFNIADLDVLTATKSLEMQRKIKAEEEQLRVLGNKLRDFEITEDEFEKRSEKLIEKIMRIADMYGVKFDKADKAKDIPGAFEQIEELLGQ
jgi:hypothetical protein